MGIMLNTDRDTDEEITTPITLQAQQYNTWAKYGDPRNWQGT